VNSVVICVGNAFASLDDAGPRVYDVLAASPRPAGLRIVDGGLGGLDLLRFVEGAERVVFVDAVRGFAAPGDVVQLDAAQGGRAALEGYDHAAGLAYLLRALPHVLEGEAPEIALVGIEAPAREGSIEEAAEMALALAIAGRAN
jgi:hydrogenase maturation protease